MGKHPAPEKKFSLRNLRAKFKSAQSQVEDAVHGVDATFGAANAGVDKLGKLSSQFSNVTSTPFPNYSVPSSPQSLPSLPALPYANSWSPASGSPYSSNFPSPGFEKVLPFVPPVPPIPQIRVTDIVDSFPATPPAIPYTPPSVDDGQSSVYLPWDSNQTTEDSGSGNASSPDNYIQDTSTQETTTQDGSTDETSAQDTSSGQEEDKPEEKEPKANERPERGTYPYVFTFCSDYDSHSLGVAHPPELIAEQKPIEVAALDHHAEVADASTMVHNMKIGINDLPLEIPKLVGVLDDIARIHPSISGMCSTLICRGGLASDQPCAIFSVVVLAFKAAYNMERARRENDKRILLLYSAMKDMLAVLVQ